MRNIQFLKDLYPAGTRVKLVEMNDIQAKQEELYQNLPETVQNGLTKHTQPR